MRLIDADALACRLEDWKGDEEDLDRSDPHDLGYYAAMCRALRFAKDAPTIDAVQVITNGQDTTYLRVKSIDDLRGRLIFEEDAGNGCAVYYEDTDDVEPVVRCKDCACYKKRHVLTADGEEKSYEEMPPEAFGGLDDMYVTMEYGINVGGKCMLDEGRGYPVDKSVFRSPNDYCSYGIRMDGDPHAAGQ